MLNFKIKNDTKLNNPIDLFQTYSIIITFYLFSDLLTYEKCRSSRSSLVDLGLSPGSPGGGDPAWLSRRRVHDRVVVADHASQLELVADGLLFPSIGDFLLLLLPTDPDDLRQLASVLLAIGVFLPVLPDLVHVQPPLSIHIISLCLHSRQAVILAHRAHLS